MCSYCSSSDISKKIVKKLDGIPLAIEQVKALLQEFIAIDEFLDIYEKDYTRVMESKPERGCWDYDKNRTILKVLSLTDKRLSEVSQDAAKLLMLISCFGPITTEFKALNMVQDMQEFKPVLTDSQGLSDKLKWLMGLRRSKFILPQAIYTLEKFSIVKTRKGSDGSIVSFSVHGSVCRWRLETLDLTEREDWIMLAAFILGQQLPEIDTDKIPQLQNLALVKHSWDLFQRYITPESIEPLEGRLCHPYGSVIGRYGSLCLHHGNVTEAERMLTAAVLYNKLIQDVLWPKDKRSLLLMKHMAIAQWKIGNLTLATETLESLYKSSSIVIGNEDGLVTWAAKQLRDVRHRNVVYSHMERRAVIASAGSKRNWTNPLEDGTPRALEHMSADEILSEMSDEEYTLRKTVERFQQEFGETDIDTCRAIDSLAAYYEQQGEITKGQKVRTWYLRAKFGKTALHEAVLSQDKSSVERLLHDGANVSAKDDQGNTPLHLGLNHPAQDDNSAAIVLTLIAKGADLDAQSHIGLTPLLLATQHNNLQALELLLNEGAILDILAYNGDAILHRAAYHNSVESLKFLLELGAEVNARNSREETPLYLAAQKGHQEITEQLLAHEAEINIQDSKRSTPLHWAALYGHQQVVKQLLKKGANVNAQDKDGRTPLLYAERDNNSAVIELLLKEGAVRTPSSSVPSAITEVE